MERVTGEIGEKIDAAGRLPRRIELFRAMSMAETLAPFLTPPASRLIV